MSEKERVLQAIERILTKRAAQTDPLCRRYYELCLIGWEAHLKRLERPLRGIEGVGYWLLGMLILPVAIW